MTTAHVSDADVTAGGSTAVIEVENLTKRFGALTAVSDVSFQIQTHTITGLLGRNGAGKSTLMQLLTGQAFATSGSIRVFGQSPVENSRVLGEVCFVRENQRYPDDFRPHHVFRSAPWFFKHWDAHFAERLIADFRLPLNRRIKKLSRGQLSSIGVIVGLASRAPLTFFDEPYLGLDAVSRRIFYDRLREDHLLHPRTVVLSTHLIDEVSDLLDHVLVVHEGKMIIDTSAEAIRSSATTVVGTRSAIDTFTAHREVLHRDHVGSLASVIVGPLDAPTKSAALAAGLELTPVSLQDIIVQKTATS